MQDNLHNNLGIHIEGAVLDSTKPAGHLFLFDDVNKITSTARQSSFSPTLNELPPNINISVDINFNFKFSSCNFNLIATDENIDYFFKKPNEYATLSARIDKEDVSVPSSTFVTSDGGTIPSGTVIYIGDETIIVGELSGGNYPLTRGCGIFQSSDNTLVRDLKAQIHEPGSIVYDRMPYIELRKVTLFYFDDAVDPIDSLGANNLRIIWAGFVSNVRTNEDQTILEFETVDYLSTILNINAGSNKLLSFPTTSFFYKASNGGANNGNIVLEGTIQAQNTRDVTWINASRLIDHSLTGSSGTGTGVERVAERAFLVDDTIWKFQGNQNRDYVSTKLPLYNIYPEDKEINVTLGSGVKFREVLAVDRRSNSPNEWFSTFVAPAVIDTNDFGLWTPDNLAVTSSCWLDSSSDDYLTLSGSSVTGMTDRSGNARHGVVTGSGSPITLTDINGIQALQYTEDNTYVQIPLTTATARYVIGVFDDSTDSNNQYMVLSDSTTLSRYLGAVFGGSSGTTVSNSVTDITWRINGESEIPSTQSELELLVKNGTIFSSDWTSLTGWANISLHAYPAFPAWNYGGKVGEYIFLDYIPTTDEKQKLEGYLAHKWGYTSKLPVGHPYKIKKPTFTGTGEEIKPALVGVGVGVNVDRPSTESYEDLYPIMFDTDNVTYNNSKIINQPQKFEYGFAFHPLSIALSLLLSRRYKIDIDNWNTEDLNNPEFLDENGFNIRYLFDVLSIEYGAGIDKELIDCEAWINEIHKSPSAFIEQINLNIDETYNILDVVADLLSTRGYFLTLDDLGRITLGRLTDYSYAKAIEVNKFSNEIDRKWASLINPDIKLAKNKQNNRLQVEVGNNYRENGGNATIATIKGNRTDFSIGNSETKPFNFNFYNNSRLLSSGFSFIERLMAFQIYIRSEGIPIMTIKTPWKWINEDGSRCQMPQLGQWVRLTGGPETGVIGPDGTRLQTDEEDVTFAGFIINRTFNIADMTVESDVLMINWFKGNALPLHVAPAASAYDYDEDFKTVKIFGPQPLTGNQLEPTIEYIAALKTFLLNERVTFHGFDGRPCNTMKAISGNNYFVIEDIVPTLGSNGRTVFFTLTLDTYISNTEFIFNRNDVVMRLAPYPLYINNTDINIPDSQFLPERYKYRFWSFIADNNKKFSNNDNADIWSAE